MRISVVKYLGLLAMSKILKTHPKSVQSHKDLILQCLDDKDESIRLRALDLLYGMVCSQTFDFCFIQCSRKLMLNIFRSGLCLFQSILKNTVQCNTKNRTFAVTTLL